MADGSYAKAHQDAAGGKGGPRFKLLDALAVALPPKSTLSWTGCHHRGRVETSFARSPGDQGPEQQPSPVVEG